MKERKSNYLFISSIKINSNINIGKKRRVTINSLSYLALLNSSPRNIIPFLASFTTNTLKELKQIMNI